MNFPKRAVEINLKIGADSMRSLVDSLNHIAFDLDAEIIKGPTCISGSPSCGYILEIDRSPEITPEIYQETLAKFIKAGKQEKQPS